MVELDMSSPVASAARRMTLYIDSGYAPQQMAGDMRLLINAALAWDVTYQKKWDEEAQATLNRAGKRGT